MYVSGFACLCLCVCVREAVPLCKRFCPLRICDVELTEDMKCPAQCCHLAVADESPLGAFEITVRKSCGSLWRSTMTNVSKCHIMFHSAQFYDMPSRSVLMCTRSHSTCTSDSPWECEGILCMFLSGCRNDICV